MVGHAQLKHVGAVGAKLIYPDKTIQHGGILLTDNYVACSAFSFEPYESTGFFSRLCVPYNYSAVTAACLMIEKKKYLEVNGLEEKLKVAFNDVDFCLKLRKAGYHNVFLPMVELYHYESKSRGLDDNPEKYQRFLFENEYMHKKWDDIIKNDPFYNPNYSLEKAYKLDK
jgi:GT2 family glycosyltransferase